MVTRSNLRQDDISQLMQDPNSATGLYMYDALIHKSNEITYYNLLCMIYRATPPSAKTIHDSTVECIKYARAALDCHRRCTTTFKDQPEMWTAYLHW
jgi:hypothetical protein